MKTIGILLICILLVCLGCEQRPVTTPPVTAPNTVSIDGHQITAQPGSSITVRREESRGSEIQKGSASGVGAGLKNGGKDVAGDFDASAPSAGGGGWAANGGGSKITYTALGGSETSPLMWAGIACLVGAGVAFYFGLRRASLVCGVLGGVFIVASVLPVSFYVAIGIIAAAVVVAIGVYLLAEHKGKSREELSISFADARRQFQKEHPAEAALFDKILEQHLWKQGAIDDKKTLAAVQAKAGVI